MMAGGLEHSDAGAAGLGADRAAGRAGAGSVRGRNLCRGQEALAAARQAHDHDHPYVSAWTLPKLIEAAVHTGDTRAADVALDLRPRGHGRAEPNGLEQLRTATQMLAAMGGRIRRAGPARVAGHRRHRGQARGPGHPSARRGGQETPTVREAQVSRLASDGLSNPQIAPGCSSADARSSIT